MIILDTNVISEVLRSKPDMNVLSWFGIPRRKTLYTTSITRAELMRGAEILPQGKRKAALQAIVREVLDTDLKGKILSFDSRSADVYAVISATRQAKGHPISQSDAMIAAIALVHNAAIATRNTKDFTGLGLTLIDPWEAKQSLP